MLKIAITGNIAAGKSEVEKIISENYPVYDADKIAHKFLGNVDRRALGEKVFNEPIARKELESIIHPKVKNEILNIFTKITTPVVFVSIPLLFETGFDKLFDKVLFVQCNDDIRLEHLMKRNNFTKEQALARMNSQMAQEEKIVKSDYVIYNNSGLDELKKQVTKFIDELPS